MITDSELCEAIKAAQKGQADDLGGGVYKKRLSENRNRSIILAKGGNNWFYTYLFEKQNKTTLKPDELKAFKELADKYAGFDDKNLKKLIKDKEITEICTDE